MVLLSEFYEEDRTDAFLAERDAMWMDVLEGLPQDAIKAAVIDYQQNGPRSDRGRLIRPSAGDIYDRACRIMRRAAPAPVVTLPPPIHRPSAESKRNIQDLIREAGFTPRRVPAAGGDE